MRYLVNVRYHICCRTANGPHHAYHYLASWFSILLFGFYYFTCHPCNLFSKLVDFMMFVGGGDAVPANPFNDASHSCVIEYRTTPDAIRVWQGVGRA